MKKIVLFLLLGILFIGCESSERKAVNKYYEDRLKDPSSFVVYSFKPYDKKATTTEKTYILDYGAKNGFGAMDRETAIIEFEDDKIIFVGTELEYDVRKNNELMNILNEVISE